MVPARYLDRTIGADLAHALLPLRGNVHDDETLFELIGDSPVVFLGESTHGTHEFYRARIEITKRLIADRSFTAVCIEADSSNAGRLDRYVRGTGEDTGAIESLGGFTRFPAWVWHNAEVLGFIAWLRDYNDRATALRRPAAGFCGFDIVPNHAKVVIWAHNKNAGAFTCGRSGNDVVSIGFTTYSGTVTAASEWLAPAERKRIVPARGDSYEYLFHSTNVPRFLVPLRAHRPKLAGLPQQARERAIGAIYRPECEAYSDYFTAQLIDQFDAVYHFDVTRALDPLEPNGHWEASVMSPASRAGECG